MIHWAMIDVMGRRLTGETTPTWQNQATNPDTSSAI